MSAFCASWYVTKCKSCKARVIWAIGSKGGKAIVDAEPVAEGNLVLEKRLRSSTPGAVPFQPLIHSESPRYVSHFVTCPQAREWRKKSA